MREYYSSICNTSNEFAKMFLLPLPFLPLERPDLEILLHLTVVETQTSKIWKEKKAILLELLQF